MKEFKFMWFIENYSYCWHETGKQIVSPTFFIEMMEKTSWNLGLYPKGATNDEFISLYLNRSSSCGRPEKIVVNYELSLLDSKDNVLETVEIREYGFKKGVGYGSTLFVKRDKINGQFLAKDVLKVCCKMWSGEGKVDKGVCSYARTRIGIEKISFVNTIEKFSLLELNQKNSFEVNPVSKDGLKLLGNVYVSCEQDCEKEVVVEITPDSKKIFITSCKLYLLNSAGNETEVGKTEIKNVPSRKHTVQALIKFNKRALLEKKLDYLANDTLTFRGECMFSTGIESQRIEETFHDLHLTPFLKTNSYSPTAAVSLPETKSFMDDFRSLYDQRIHCDIQLKTKSKMFSAHKVVLCARSSVFSMLIANMSQKPMDYIEIEDLEDTTMEQFLHFIYTDVLEDLLWDSAIKLYYAANKYQVQRLKNLCSSFFIRKLDTLNVYDLLTLSEKSDSSLKTIAEDFIYKNEEQIFGSEEFKCFMEKNPHLAMQTMEHLLLKKRNKYLSL